jgi:hypothetical protein
MMTITGHPLTVVEETVSGTILWWMTTTMGEAWLKFWAKA